MNGTSPISKYSSEILPPGLLTGRIRLLRISTAVLALAWTLVISLALVSASRHESTSSLKSATIEAKASVQKDLVYRHWIASHDGVYVPVTDQTPSNPYLTNHVERDVTTISGRSLTLVNAAYMDRQIYELSKRFGVPGIHLTSLKPIRPENAPDGWEIKALQAIEAGQQEISSVEDYDGKSSLRFMKALVIDKSCLSCHVTEGYKEGERHGGMSIMVDMSPFQAIARTHNRQDIINYASLWVFGLCGLGFGHLIVGRRLQDHDAAASRLQAVEAELADFYNHAPDMFLLIDAAMGRILSCNVKLLEKTGRTREKTIGLPLIGLVAPNEALRIIAALEEFRRSGEIRLLEFQMPAAQGSVLDVELNATAILDKQGRMVRGRVVLRDITEPKRLEAALHASEERYRLVSENTVDWVFWLRPDGKFLFNSPSCQRVTGHASAEFVHDPTLLERILFPADVTLWDIHRCKVAKDCVPSNLEFRIVRPDGEIRWLRHVCQPVHDKSGRFLGTCSSNAEITEQKRAAEALQRHGEILKAVSTAAERFLCVPDWRNVINEVLEQLGKAAEVSRVGIFERHPETDLENFVSQIYEWAATGLKPRTEDSSWKKVPMRASGFERWVEILRRGNSLHGTVRDFPTNEQSILMDYQIRSIAVMPIMVKGIWWGFVAFEEYVTERAWRTEELDALTAAANILGGTIERQRAEQELRDSEDRFRTLVDCVPAGIFVVANRRFEYLNEQAIKSFGADSPGQLIGKNVMDRVHPDFHILVTGRIQRLETEHDSVPLVQAKYLKMDGTAVDVEVAASAIIFNGKWSALVIFRDITERRNIEIALRESEDRYRSLVEGSPDAIGIYQNDRLIFINATGTEMFGAKSSAELIGRRSRQIIHPADHPAALNRIRRRLAGEEGIYPVEVRYLRLDGDSLPVEVSITPINFGGKAAVQFIARDITVRKQAEEQLRKLSRAVEQSPASIVITNTRAEIEYINPKFTKVTGYTFEDVRGRNPRVLKSGETPDEVYRQLWQTLQQGKEWRGEFHNRKKDGKLFWEFASISPILDDAGRITHFLAVKEDITERKLLEIQFRQAQKMESIGLLAGGVAHDFNNILAATMLHIELWQQNPDLNQDARESLNELMTLARRAAGLTRQLLMFSRQSVMQVRTLDLNEVVENLLKMLRRLIGEDINLEWQGQSRPAVITADAGMIEQTVMNLVVNARDAMPNGGVISIATTTVELSAEQTRDHPERRPGRFVCLIISDTGTGMSEETLGHIFEPFFTTKEAGKGTGLGLATVYGIAQQHKGWVLAESEIGKGSKFSVFIPFDESSVAENNSAKKPAALPRGKETILLVEDDPSLRLSLGSLLRSLGYTVIEAGNGTAALAIWPAEQSHVDLLMTDMVMPDGVNGLELAMRLQKARPDLKVIISSGYTTCQIKPEELAANGILYLPKPCAPGVLAGTLRKCLSSTG